MFLATEADLKSMSSRCKKVGGVPEKECRIPESILNHEFPFPKWIWVFPFEMLSDEASGWLPEPSARPGWLGKPPECILAKHS